MPRRKQQSPKRLKTCLETGQEMDVDDDKLDDDDVCNVSMDAEDADDEGDGEKYGIRKYIKRKKNYERGNGGRQESYRDERDTLSDYSDEEDRPLNLSGLMGLKATVEPHHIVHYLPSTPPNGVQERDSDEANAQAAAVAASIALKSGEQTNLSAAHATWVQSVQEMMSAENMGEETISHCLECNSRFVSNDELLVHLQETGHITGRPLDPSVNDVSTCKGYDLCIGPNGQLFSKCFLRRQQKRSTETGTNVCNLRCKQCSKTFPTLLALTLHMKELKHFNPNRGNRRKKPKTHHLDYEEEIQVDKVMKCMVCNRSFDNLQDLTMHMMETEHFSRVPGYKTETLLQQQQEQLQQEQEAEELIPEEKEENPLVESEKKMRVIVSDPPVIAAARAIRKVASEAKTHSSTVNMSPITTHRTVLDGLSTPMPPNHSNHRGMTVRARLQNKTNNSRVLRCLACDHSFDNIHSLTKHMTITGHYQKTSDDGLLSQSTMPLEANGNMVKWELVSTVPTSNGIYTHVKSKVISHSIKREAETPDHSEGRSESPQLKQRLRNTPPLTDEIAAKNPTSTHNVPEPDIRIPTNRSREVKYLNPDHFEFQMRNNLNPLGNLEALVHGATMGRFSMRTANNIPMSMKLPERAHTVHWTHLPMNLNNPSYDCPVPLKSSHASGQCNRSNNCNDRNCNFFATMASEDKPLDFSMPKQPRNNKNESNSRDNNNRTYNAAPLVTIKAEPRDTMEVQAEPLALTVKKKKTDTENKAKVESRYEGLASKIKTEQTSSESVRRSPRVHSISNKKVKQEYMITPLEASSEGRVRDRNKTKNCSPERLTKSKHSVTSCDAVDAPRTVYPQVNQNGYLATTKGGVLPMGTGAYEGQNDDPLKAMNKLVQNAVVGRQSPGSRQSSRIDNTGTPDGETECGLKIALFGPIMGNDDVASNPLEEIDKLVNAAI
ncbi:uncharacterized protein LOC102801864 [Saccoglossus kowalevskii]|uniref:Teashirt homolog 1-like n=1 Tax=Saccoglossus kowalevskii TaxID=10224 RepID=A0ABM0MA88_SACKO|nr:PREDICTED: teashirt homolog 1-like [Saccoglossus kowalevskii]